MGNTGPLAKTAALRILDLLLADSSRPRYMDSARSSSDRLRAHRREHRLAAGRAPRARLTCRWRRRRSSSADPHHASTARRPRRAEWLRSDWRSGLLRRRRRRAPDAIVWPRALGDRRCGWCRRHRRTLPLVIAGGAPARAAVSVLRSRNDRAERRRRARSRFSSAAAGSTTRAVSSRGSSCCAIRRRAGAARSGRRRARDAPARSSASTASRSTRRCLKRGICFTGSNGPARRAAAPRRAASGAAILGLEGPAELRDGCSLGTLERAVLGARRVGDVPGFEIPGPLFQFVRSGDARPLEAVLEHNRLDLLSLAGLTARLLQPIAGPGRCPTMRAKRWRSGRSTRAPGSSRAHATRTRARSTSARRGRAARFGAAVH